MKENPPPTGRSVFARANALMQLRRNPNAESVVSAEPPVLTEALLDEDDLPLLTDVADATDLAENLATKPATTKTEPPAAVEPAAITLFSPSQLDQLSAELSRRVQQRLAAELPSLVEAALQSSLAGLTRELESGLSEIAREAIQDFLAEHSKTPQ